MVKFTSRLTRTPIGNLWLFLVMKVWAHPKKTVTYLG
ncbi:hypothetical protein T06_11264 [Trichinella sp. T6]|nr:hypothetical protein T06_11264 [Trichinella sp. T6]